MDPFHAVAWVSDALDEVRQQALRDAREVYNSLPKGKRGRPAKDDPNAKARAVALAKVKEVEGTRWSLLKNPEDLTERQKETLDKVSKANRRLYRAYNLKEGFRDVFSLGPAEGITEDLLKIWLSRACRSKIPEMVKVSRSIRKRKEEILAAVEYGLSNSRLEATNNKIKVAIRMGYGYSNFENLKAIVMLRCCGVKLDLPGRMPTGWRTKGFARRTRSNMKPRKKVVDVKTTA
jgi:transposase